MSVNDLIVAPILSTAFGTLTIAEMGFIPLKHGAIKTGELIDKAKTKSALNLGDKLLALTTEKPKDSK